MKRWYFHSWSWCAWCFLLLALEFSTGKCLICGWGSKWNCCYTTDEHPIESEHSTKAIIDETSRNEFFFISCNLCRRRWFHSRVCWNVKFHKSTLCTWANHHRDAMVEMQRRVKIHFAWTSRTHMFPEQRMTIAHILRHTLWWQYDT